MLVGQREARPTRVAGITWVVVVGVAMMAMAAVAHIPAKVRAGVTVIGIPITVRMSMENLAASPPDRLPGTVLAVGVLLVLSRTGAIGQQPTPMEPVLVVVAALVPLSVLRATTEKVVVLMAQVATGVVRPAGPIMEIPAKVVVASMEVQVGATGNSRLLWPWQV